MEPFVGLVIAVGFNFAPVGWLLCNGQLVSISEYEVLFNLLGTTYGGDGQTNFAVPDLRGRTPVSMGNGVAIGQPSGTESVTLNGTQIGAHSHNLMTSSKASTTNTPAGNLVLGTAAPTGSVVLSVYTAKQPTSVTMAAAAITSAGSSVPHENRQPFLAVNYIIAAFGIYPSQG